MELWCIAFFGVLTTALCADLTQKRVPDCERKYPGCTTWPAYSITRAEFEATNGSVPAGMKAEWEEAEAGEHPYRVTVAVNALLELKALALEDPWGYTADWSPGRHPCDFSQIICNQHGMVVGVDMGSMAPRIPAYVASEQALGGGSAERGVKGGNVRTDGLETERPSFQLNEAQLPTLALERLPGGPAWQELGLMSLKVVRFDNARLAQAQLPESWGGFPWLREVSLGGCGLQGVLPRSWGGLARLARLDLSDNSLGGGLPGEWSGMESLQVLDMSLQRGAEGDGARLSGLLPDDWQFLLRLQVLDLWNQGITGTLPASWGELPSLEVVSLSGTHISGVLPDAWARMGNLTTLGLAETGVSGPLPRSWGSMLNLTWFDARGTRISGGVPHTWRSFCRGKKSSGAFPSFAYLPWQGVTEINSARGESELNLCSAWRRRQRWQASALILLLVIGALFLLQRRKGGIWQWRSPHAKSK